MIIKQNASKCNRLRCLKCKFVQNVYSAAMLLCNIDSIAFLLTIIRENSGNKFCNIRLTLQNQYN